MLCFGLLNLKEPVELSSKPLSELDPSPFPVDIILFSLLERAELKS
jgi:hypothetical protein